jgi:hypothetical protein
LVGERETENPDFEPTKEEERGSEGRKWMVQQMDHRVVTSFLKVFETERGVFPLIHIVGD